MNKEYQSLLNEYELEVTACAKAETLEQLQEAYTNVTSMRDEILNFIESVTAGNDELYIELVNSFQEQDELFMSSNPIRVFDESLDEVNLFDEYTTYFQRYGCLTHEWIISWDENNILFHDVDSDLVEIVQRPDVLMRGSE